MDAITVVGAGGIGCAVGYALRATGAQVLFVESDPRKIVAGVRGHLQVEGHPLQTARFVHFDAWEPSSEDVILLCTKCYNNARVLARVPAGATLIPIQNGFDPELADFDHDFEGIASFVSQCDPGRTRVQITRRGDLHMGRRSAGSRLRPRPEVFDLLSASKLFRVIEVPVIEPFKYAKLMYNAAISPIAAAAGMDNGKLLSDPRLRRVFFALLVENHRILAGAGIPLGRIGPFRPATVARILRNGWLANALARVLEPSLRGTYCSMAAEIPSGRTEIDYYNGHLIQLAERSGTPCPLNRAVHDLVSGMAAQRARPTPSAWEHLAAA